ncbi:MAG: flagellar export protein FliJ [Bacteroidetes bacterium]|nr:flagellar export protein FliJ [Bacteroidota bacterium]
MATFNFKFKTVQNVKKNFEKKAQKELALIDSKIKGLENINKELQQEIKNHKLSTENNTKVADVQFIKGYAIYLDAIINSNNKLIDELIIERNKKIDELVQKSKEHKMFNKLEEHHLERFNKAQNKTELKNMDEIAIQKFARIKK